MNRVNNQLKKTNELSQLLTLDRAFTTYLSKAQESQIINNSNSKLKLISVNEFYT